jgi:two-component system OmpR family response regulator
MVGARVPERRVLVVEDDRQVSLGLEEGLSAEGYQVTAVRSTEEARSVLSKRAIDVMVLDLLLGSEESWPLLPEAAVRRVPVIVLTARVDVATRLRALEGGAVDYLPKPFFLAELVARIRLRTTPANEPSERVAFGEALLDLARRELLVGGEPVALTPGEFEVLAHLVTRPGRAVSRAALAFEVLSGDSERLERTADSHVSRIRAKLGDAATHIKTVWGIGWRFEP